MSGVSLVNYNKLDSITSQSSESVRASQYTPYARVTKRHAHL